MVRRPGVRAPHEGGSRGFLSLYPPGAGTPCRHLRHLRQARRKDGLLGRGLLKNAKKRGRTPGPPSLYMFSEDRRTEGRFFCLTILSRRIRRKNRPSICLSAGAKKLYENWKFRACESFGRFGAIWRGLVGAGHWPARNTFLAQLQGLICRGTTLRPK